MNIRTVTEYFSSAYAAVKYYGSSEEAAAALEEGRIKIGRPTVPEGCKLLIDGDFRYHLETISPTTLGADRLQQEP